MAYRAFPELSKVLAVAGIIAVAPLAVAPATAQAKGIDALIGTWGGTGRITYTDGSSEGIRCTAYHSGGGNELHMVIQCRSDKNPIHIRSRLRIDGSRASGDWEERTFNAAGEASGTVSSGSLSLRITGGGLSGSMSVSFGGSTHTVSITTEGIAMSRCSISFSRK